MNSIKYLFSLVVLLVLVSVATAFAGNVQSNGTGGGLWSATGTWAGNVAPVAGDNVTIVSGDSVYLGAAQSCTNCTVNSGGKLDNKGNALTVSATFTLQVNSIYYIGGSLTSVPGATRSLDNASTVVFNGSQTSISTTSFGNLIWSTGGNATPGSGITVNGDLTITAGHLRGHTGTSGGTRTHTVAGNVFLTGTGGLCGDNGTASQPTSTYAQWIIGGNVTLSGTAILSTTESASALGTGLISIGGNLTVGSGCKLEYATNTGSTITALGLVEIKGNFINNGSIVTTATGTPGNFWINFMGSGTQTVSGTGTFGTLLNLNDSVGVGSTVVIPTGVNWGSSTTNPPAGTFLVLGTLDMQGTSTMLGGNAFTLGSGGTLKTANTNGLTSTASTGSIQVTGTRTYSTGGNYVFDAGAAQVTGTQMPSTVNKLFFINSSGVTVSQATAVSDTFQTNGTVTNSSNLTLNGFAILNAGNFDTSPTYGSSSTLDYNTGGTYGRYVEWNSTSGAGYPANLKISNNTTLNYPNGNTSAKSISGSLTIDAGSALYMDYSTAHENAPLTVGGNLNLAGAMSLGDDIGGDLILNGNWNNNGGSFFANTRAVQFSGSSQQTIGGTTVTTFPYLTVTNTNGVALSQSATVGNNVNLGSSVITTGANTLTLNAGGSVSRSTGFVDGNFAKVIGTGSPSVTYEVGSGANYTPVQVDFSGISSGGTLTAKSTGAEDTHIATSGLDANKTVNRYYTMTNSGITPSNYDITLNWVAGDVDGGATTSNFVVKKYDSGTWSSPTSVNQTATSIKATGLTSFSEFAVGDTIPPASAAPVVASPIGAGATSVSGASSEADGTTIDLYVNGIDVGTTTVTSGAWTKSSITALSAGDLVKATATASGKSVSAFSNVVTVQAYSAAPVVDGPIGAGATTVSGTSSEGDGTIIDVYVNGTDIGTTTVSTGTWSKSVTALVAGDQVKATATAAGKLVSGYATIVTVQAYTTAPTLNSPIAEGATSVSGTSSEANGTVIDVILNGSSTIGSTTVSSGVWTVTGLTPLVAGQNITAKATATGKLQSEASNSVTVQAYSAAPVVTGPIGVGATSVSGTSSEADGTVIDVYVDGSDLYTTTVASGAWTKSGMTALAGGQLVKATATATGKLVSGFSNTVTVSAALTISTASPLPAATAGTAYAETLAASGGSSPYGDWKLISGGLPSGITLNSSTGILSGTATVAGPYSFTIQVADAVPESTSKAFSLTVNPGALDHFAIASISTPQTAGTPFSIAITAQDANNNTVTGFGGTVGIVPSTGSISPTTSGTFSSGTRSESVTLTAAVTGMTIEVNYLTHTGMSNTFDVIPGALDHFAIGPVSDPETAGAAFAINVTAQDLNNNTVTGFVSPVNITTNAGTVSPTTSSAFTLGTLTQMVTVTQTGASKTVGVNDGSGHTGTSNTFTVNAGGVDHFVFATISSPQTTGVPFNITITAQDVYNNTATSFVSTVNLSISTGSIVPTVSGAFSSGTRTESVTASTAGLAETITADDGSGHTITSNSFDVFAPTDFRSAASGGNWNSTAAWEMNNGFGWVSATHTPTYTDNNIEITNGNPITVTANVTADQITIDASALLTINAADTLTVANGAGTDLTVNGNLYNAGRLNMNGSTSAAFNSTAYYTHAVYTAEVPKTNSTNSVTVTWDPASTVEITGPTGTSNLSGMFTTNPANGNWGNIIWNTTNMTGTGNFNFGANLTNILGSFTMKSTGSGPAILRFFAGSTANKTINVGGDFVIQGGSFQIGAGGTSTGNVLNIGGSWNQTGGVFASNVGGSNFLDVNFTGANKTFTQSAGTLTNTSMCWNVKSGASLTLQNSISVTSTDSVIVASGGTLNCGTNTISGGVFLLNSGGTLGIGAVGGIAASAASGNIQTTTRLFNTGANYTYNGLSSQASGDGLPATVNNLTLDNSTSMVIWQSTLVNGTLGLTNGILTTSGSTLEVASSGNVSRTNGWVWGNLKKTIASPSDSKSYEIGDATLYAPVDVAGSSYSAPFGLTATTATGDHSQIGSSGIDATNSVNRTYTLTGVATGPSNVTFHYNNPADIDAGANPNVFIIGKYDSPTWTKPTVGTRTSTSTEATNVASFSDFAIGQAVPAGSFSASTLSIDFGSVIVGNFLKDSLYAKNNSAGPLNISSVISDNGVFTVTPSSATLAAHDSAWFYVTFTPSASGVQNGNIVFTNDGGGSPDTVTVTGNGYIVSPIFTINKTTINFGTVFTGVSKMDSVTVQNTGTSDLHNTSVVSDAGVFTVTPASDTLAPGNSAKFYITFTPVAGVASSGNIVFTNNATGSPDTVKVSGTGLVPAPTFSVAPTSLDFGTITVSTSLMDSLEVYNAGTATLHITHVASDTSVYVVTPTSGTVAVNDSAKFYVTFNPLAAGTVNGHITFTHDAAGSPSVVPVTGSGTLGPRTVNSNGSGGGLWNTGSTWVGSIPPSAIDTAVIVATDSVAVAAPGTCAKLIVQAGTKLTLFAKLSTGPVTLNGKISVYADTLKVTGAMSVNNGGVYEHARDAGKFPVATWNTGSTLLVTGLTGSGPGSGLQTYYNITWNCPNQSANLNLGWNPLAGRDTTVTVNGDITVLASGAGSRWQLAGPPSPPAGQRSSTHVIINGNVNVSGGAFSTNGSSTGNTDIFVLQHGNINVTGGNFSISRGSQAGTGTATWILDQGNFSMSNATTQNSDTGRFAARFVFKKQGTQTLTLGTGNTLTNLPIEIDSGTTLNTGVSQIRGSGTFVLQPTATLVTGIQGGIDSLLATSGYKSLSIGANYTFNGAAAQMAGILLPDTVNNLTVNNAAGLTLSKNVLVNGALTFTAGKLTTGGFITKIAPAGTVSGAGAGKYVNGMLTKTVAAGADTKTFEIGDTSAYTPVVMTGASYASPFPVTALTVKGDDPQLSGAGLDPTKSVNRYYTLTGVPTGSSNITFNFVAGDVDAGANTNNFLIAKHDSTVWILPTVGTRTATSTQATGITSFSDFAIAELGNFAITASSDTNGTIAPSGSVSVPYSGNQTFTFTPHTGYHVDSVFVDGAYVDTALTTYKFNNVTTVHTISVKFAINTYTLGVAIVGSGSVTKNPDQPLYNYGTTDTLTAHPAWGWNFTGWSGDASGLSNPLTVLMTANKNITATFTQDSAYLTTYRTMRPDSIVYSYDNTGKFGKMVPTKADKVYFEFPITVQVDSVTGQKLTLTLNAKSTGVIYGSPAGLDTLAVFTNTAKPVIVFNPPLRFGKVIRVKGIGVSAKVLTATQAWNKNRANKITVFTDNHTGLPMPNRVNIIYDVYKQGGFPAKTGMVVGVPRTDSAKKYGWVQLKTSTDVQKSLSVVSNKVRYLHTGAPRGFDSVVSGKKMVSFLGKKSSLPPIVQNNKLFADMVALKLSIAASSMEKTPLGLGELVFDDTVANRFNGMKLKDIAAKADTMMTGYPGRTFESAGTYATLATTIERVLNAFEGPIDTFSFGGGKLRTKGTHQLVEFPFLRHDPNAVPAKITPAVMAEPTIPEAFALLQNYPNPFNPTTTIEFNLPAASTVTLKIYNLLGQEVATVFDHQDMDAGTQDIQFNALNFASGVYFYRITAKSVNDEGVSSTFTSVKKMILMK